MLHVCCGEAHGFDYESEDDDGLFDTRLEYEVIDPVALKFNYYLYKVFQKPPSPPSSFGVYVANSERCGTVHLEKGPIHWRLRWEEAKMDIQ